MILAKGVVHVFMGGGRGGYLALFDERDNLISRVLEFGAIVRVASSASDEAHAFSDEVLQHFLGLGLLREEGKEAAEAEIVKVGESEMLSHFFFDTA